MSKPLSQEEIDVLLEVRSQMNEADSYDFDALESIMSVKPEKRINPYNFKRPRLFSQDQMRLVGHVHEAFARDLSVYLSAQLRTIVDITLTAVDQVLYSEFVMSSAPPSALYVADAVGMGHKIVVELDPRLVIFTTEKLFGGPGEFLKQPREVSLIEQRIMGKVMERAFYELEKAWKQVHTVDFEEDTFESNAEFVQIISGVEPAIVGTFEVTVYDQHSFINICYPYILLERILGRSGLNQWISSATTDVSPAVREYFESNLRTTSVDMHAELGRTKLPVTDLMRLEVGDVIPLQRRIDEPICVLVGGTEKFKAVPGRSGKRRSIRITDVIESQYLPDEDE